MKRSTKTARQIKTLSLLLTLVLLLTNVFGAGVTAQPLSEENRQIQDELTLFTPDDPLKYMQDIPVEPHRIADDLDIYITDDPEYNERIQQELEEPVFDDGSTDRYIVKYKSGQKQTFENKLSSKISRSEKISDIAVFESKADSRNTGKIIDDVLYRNNDWEVLTLNEKMLPSEFAAAIRNSNAIGDIEYIQPDYKLSLDSIEEEPTSEDVDDSSDEESTTVEEIIENSGEESETIETSEGSADEDETIEEETTELIEEESTEETTEELLEEETEDLDGNEIIIAVIDTGMDIYHYDLADYVDTDNMWNFAENNDEVYSSANPYEYAHGTHIAGIIVNTVRENGIENIKILPLRVFNNGVAYTSDIMAAIEYAVLQGAKIINCSFGSTYENPALEEIMANSDALFVCAVGNNRRDLLEIPSYPACYELPNVISVASVNEDGGLSYFSNYGEIVDITALGRDVLSTLPENEYGTMTGTSMSAAYVTAVAAIVRANENLSVTELRYRLRTTSDRLSNLMYTVDRGRRVNLENAVNNIIQTNVIQNDLEEDFDDNGYQSTENDTFELYSSTSVVEVEDNTDFTIICSLNNIISFGNTYKITYNPEQAILIDFAKQTPELDVDSGVVPGTDLEILSHNTLTGELLFKVNKTLPQDCVWSGAVTILNFNAQVTGTIDIDLTTAATPQKIRNFEAVANTAEKTITFTWTNPNTGDSAAEYYELYRTSGGTTWLSPMTINADRTTVDNGTTFLTLTFDEMGIDKNGDYDFRIKACNSAGASAFVYLFADTTQGRHKISVIIPVKPMAVTDFEAESHSMSGELTLTWINPNTSVSPVGYYELYRTSNGTSWLSEPMIIQSSQTTTQSGVTSITLLAGQLGITLSGTYDFRIKACNSVGASAFVYLFADTPQGRHRVPVTVMGSMTNRPNAAVDFEASADNTAGTITFIWSNTNPAGMIGYYELYITTRGNSWIAEPVQTIINGTVTSVTYTFEQLGITASGDYDFRMKGFESPTNSSNFAYIFADTPNGRHRVSVII